MIYSNTPPENYITVHTKVEEEPEPPRTIRCLVHTLTEELERETERLSELRKPVCKPVYQWKTTIISDEETN